MKIIKHDLSKFEELELYVLSDVHFEDSLCNKKMLYKWRDEILEKPNRYVIVNGDIINAATRNSVSDVYSSLSSPDAAMDEVVAFLETIKDRILVIIDGNHEKRAYKESGIKLMKRVAHELGLKDLYVNDAYLLFLSFGKSLGRENRKMVYSVYGRHGSGGGKKIGGKANSLQDMQCTIDADIYVQGHTHQPLIFPSTFYRCDYRNKKVTAVEKMFVNTNAFLDYGGYGEELGFSPVSIKWPKLILNGYERKINGYI